MKNRYFILSVLFWAIASVCMAITLPTTSYQSSYLGSEGASEGIMLGSGTTYTQVYLSASNTDYADACYGAFSDDEDSCIECCENYEDACPAGDLDCYDKVRICKTTCHEGPSLPLGSPLLLLPFALVYAVIRKNSKDKE